MVLFCSFTLTEKAKDPTANRIQADDFLSAFWRFIIEERLQAKSGEKGRDKRGKYSRLV